MSNIGNIVRKLNNDVWEDISGHNLPTDFIKEFKDKIKWSEFDFSENLLTLKDFEELKDYIDWNNFSYSIESQEEYLNVALAFSKYVNWDIVSENLADEDYLKKVSKHINWKLFKKHNHCSFETALENESIIGNIYDIQFSSISIENFIKYHSKLDLNCKYPLFLSEINPKNFSNILEDLNKIEGLNKPFDLTLFNKTVTELLRFKEEDIRTLFSSNIINSLKISELNFDNYNELREGFINLIKSLMDNNFMNFEKILVSTSNFFKWLSSLDNKNELKISICKSLLPLIFKSKISNFKGIEFDFELIKLLKSDILKENFNILKYPKIFKLTEPEIEEWIGYLKENNSKLFIDLFFIKEYYPELSEAFLNKYEDFIE